ncbi:hypothetical protein BFJ69_g816 [Fusarium oxysporum]|uniref:Uncharacterized protein n=1 Tax=Fusarium oxysporum TaxID=5507 RepID=A0A420P449_FUSOX|nr:hypothetical protein BFJ69_g816 [Fusarium oxysporum]
MLPYIDSDEPVAEQWIDKLQKLSQTSPSQIETRF